jgi:peptidoglycan hydrolase-like protein with peptidoglycan-binding domain
MNAVLRTTTLATLALALTFGTANAADSSAVRLSQIRLANLGYDVGPRDGVIGVQTTNAIADFQAHTGLPVTGKLDADTYAVLKDTNAVAWRGTYRGNWNWAGYAYNGHRYGYAPVQTVGVSAVPVRFGNLAINENRVGNVANYTVTLNGSPVLVANNQPAPMRVSNTYRLANEDVVIFTSYDSASGCSYKNYMVSVRSDGSASTPTAVGDCSGNYRAAIEGNGLLVNYTPVGYNSWSTIRYADGTLSRL